MNAVQWEMKRKCAWKMEVSSKLLPENENFRTYVLTRAMNFTKNGRNCMRRRLTGCRNLKLSNKKRVLLQNESCIIIIVFSRNKNKPGTAQVGAISKAQ